MEWLMDPQAGFALATLTLLEIVLGVDNPHPGEDAGAEGAAAPAQAAARAAEGLAGRRHGAA